MYSWSLSVLENIMIETLASQSTVSSLAFLNRPFRLFEYVTCLLIMFFIFLISIFPLAIISPHSLRFSSFFLFYDTKIERNSGRKEENKKEKEGALPKMERHCQTGERRSRGDQKVEMVFLDWSGFRIPMWGPLPFCSWFSVSRLLIWSVWFGWLIEYWVVLSLAPERNFWLLFVEHWGICSCWSSIPLDGMHMWVKRYLFFNSYRNIKIDNVFKIF